MDTGALDYFIVDSKARDVTSVPIEDGHLREEPLNAGRRHVTLDSCFRSWSEGGDH